MERDNLRPGAGASAPSRLSRRDMLRLLASGVGATVTAALLTACGGSSETPTNTSVPVRASTTSAPTSGAASAVAISPSVASAITDASPTTSAPAANSPTASSASAATVGSYPSGGKYSTLDPIGKKGGKVTEVTTAEAKHFNPVLSSDQSSDPRNALLFNPLVDVSPDTGLPFPDLALDVPSKENGGTSSDGLTYTFKLRQGVKWHDGQPFTAKDVVFTYTTWAKKELGSSGTTPLVEAVATVTAPDDFTVVFSLKKVVADFFTNNMARIIPEHILRDVPADQIKSHPFSTGDPKATIGTGPFKMEEFVRDDHLTLAKNPIYFRGEPALDKYIFKVVKDSNAVDIQMKTAEADFGGIIDAFYDDLVKQQNVRVDVYDTFSEDGYFYQLDPTKSTLFTDKRVRQAMVYALDRDVMIKAIRSGRGIVAVGTMPVVSWAYTPDQITMKYPYDPKMAEQLLDVAGWTKGADGIRAKDGKQLSFSLWLQAGRVDFERFATAMQQQWKAIGINAAVKTEDRAAYLTRALETKDFDLLLINNAFPVDPDQSTTWKTGAVINVGSYSNPQVDSLLTQGLSELNQEKRKAIYVEMQNIIVDELPVALLDFPQALAAVNKRVHNLKPNAINTRWNAHTWWVEDGK